MTLSPAPKPGEQVWNAWVARFPSLPLPERFALLWMENRLREALTGFPDTAALTPQERRALLQWIADCLERFVEQQRRPSDGFDWSGFVSVLSSLAGAAAFGFAPWIAAGLGIVGAAAFAHKEFRNRRLNERDMIARRITTLLGELWRNFR